MMKKYLLGTTLALALLLSGTPAQAETTTTTSGDTSSMMELIKSLMKQIEDLQKQLATMRGEIKELRSDLREGVENDDVRKVQELLATDPTIYPKGKVTGYYGPLTKEAVMAFQKRHGLPETGVVDEATKKLIQDYLKKKTDGKIAPGWLKAPGLGKKIDDKKWYGDKDKDDDDDNVKATSTIKAHADGMIDAANSVIEDLEDKIEAAEEEDDLTDEEEDNIEDAKEDLTRAKAELEDAEDYFEDEEYQKAYDEAYKAKKSAYAGIDELK